MQTTFTPNISSGSLWLYLTSANPEGSCGSVKDSVLITVDPAVVVNAGNDTTICLVQNATVSLTGTITGGASTGTWSSSGDGTFSNSNTGSLSTVYTPGSQDIADLSVTLTLTSIDPVGPCNAVNDALTVTFFVNPVVNAGNDTTICAGTTIPISGTISGGATTGTWSVSIDDDGTF